ncbi:hypothetical protein Vretimale_12658 [Volvox reticuliferus]|uniref:Uncharacterized protein n=2 Tax=Volvox reticuliferus TaxID=1737510 RepID=A0A8J4GJP6_9CHLO|nr:hypothetical protein Vretifemale_172 [Volvox reticuliferus]GIM08642.1 hypothetical protein Vretimale_12658 [Volvox reticuliferus]
MQLVTSTAPLPASPRPTNPAKYCPIHPIPCVRVAFCTPHKYCRGTYAGFATMALGLRFFHPSTYVLVHSRHSPHCGSEDLEGAVAAYYDVPTVSLRDALYPLNVHRPTEGFLWAQTYNEHHPGDAGHKALADLAVHLTQETVLGLLSYPPSRDEAEKVEGPLPPPMYSGNLPPSSSVCVVGFNFTSLVVTAEGWEWTNEGTPEKPKWGYVATEPGSQLVLQLTKRLAVEGAEALDGASTIADGSASIKGSTFPVLLHYLQSYVGMGTARVECGGECECTGVNVDALHAGRSSQTYMAAVMVTWINQTLDCELQITVLDKSRDVEGGHKFKVSGLVIAFGYDAAAVASVGKWHLPSDD